MSTVKGGLWSRVRADYSMWVLMVALTAFGLWAYVTTTGLPSLLFVASVPLLGHLFVSKGSWKATAPFAALTGLMLLLALFRSDFAVMLEQGRDIGSAFAASKHYFVAPIFIWLVTWAFIFAARSLDEAQALKVFLWFGYVILALAAIQFLEAVSQFGLRRALSTNYVHSRDNMLIVGFSNTNCALLMMFWPFAMVQMARARAGFIVLVAIALVAAAFTSDTNAHLLALAASTAVFFATKYWPRSLARIAPERVAAALSLIPMLFFPAIIIGLVNSGLAQTIKTDLLPSWAARIDIWSYAVERALEKPVWGWGYEASRQFDPIIPNHPHNMALQAWLELGIPGLLLLAAFWFWLFWSLGVKGEVATEASAPKGLRDIDEVAPVVAEGDLALRFRPYLMAQATCFLVIGTLSYGLWRAWFYVLGAFAAAAAILAVKAAIRSIKLRN